MAFANINGVKMYYQVQGEGVPILFVHPPLLTSDNFNYQKTQLSDQFKVITFDMRGHGRSEASSQLLTYPLIVEDMKQLLDHLNIKKCYVCGYSTGGSIALEAQMTYADHFIGGILVSAMSEMSDWYNRTRLAAAIGITKLRAKGLISRAITRGNADQKQTYKNLYKHAMEGNVENMHQYYAYSLKYNCTEQLKYVHQPQLLIYGEKDRSFQRYRKILEKQLSDYTLHIVPKAKHQIPTKNAEEMNDIIRLWLAIEQEERDDNISNVIDLSGYRQAHEEKGPIHRQ